ncbi:MAG: type II toxin-antitoxin system HicA family toxin [Nitrospira sp.]|nr:type II toxin-antitoxin system HicA family toxin [Nitrospira sp.]
MRRSCRSRSPAPYPGVYHPLRSGPGVNSASFLGETSAASLEQHDFQIVRQRGSHIVMQRRTDSGTVTVPIPDHSEIRIGTLQSIIRQSGAPRTAFEI